MLESFEEQLFGSRLILFKRVAPSVGYVGDQNRCDANPRIDRSWVDFQRTLESSLSLSSARCGIRQLLQAPSPHHRIGRMWVDRRFVLNLATGCFHELKVERPRQTTGDLVLSLAEVATVSVEPARPKMRARFGIDQLHIHSNLVTSS